MARQLAHRQRRDRLAGVLVAVVGVVVLIVAILALQHPKQASTNAGTDTRLVTISTTVTASSRSTPPSRSSSRRRGSAATAVGSQPLIVLNATDTPNLARSAARRFQGGGWNVTTYDETYRNVIISTCAYFDPAVKGAQEAGFALQKQYPTIKRVLPRFAGLPAGPVVVVLTLDYSPG